MMRSRVCSSLAICVLLLASTSWAGQIEVFPVGVFPDDVENVQMALDSFEDGEDGVLILKARTKEGVEMPFDFGLDPDAELRGYVTPSPLQSGAIEFRGERTQDAHTVVLGGWTPIYALRHDALIVRNIEFRSSIGAVFVAESTAVLITDNVITDLTGHADRCCAAGIALQADVPGSLEEITGPVVIERNEIHGVTGYYLFGIAVVWTNARAVVADNIATGVHIGIQLLTYQQDMLLRGNTLQVADPRPMYDGSGIVMLPGTQPGARVTVSDNSISVTNSFAGGYAAGILGFIPDSEMGGNFRDSQITANELWLTNADGIQLDVSTSAAAGRIVANNLVARNRMHGDSPLRFGILATVFRGGGQIRRNQFRNNDFSGLVNPGGSDLWLGPSTLRNLAVVGPDDDVVDLRTDNVIIVRP